MNTWDASKLRFRWRFGTFLRSVFWVAVLMCGPIVSGDTFVVANTSDLGAGSLREAINQANDNVGPDTIEFNIPGAGPHTIQPTTGLPEITDTVVIDGYTQPGARPNTNAQGLGNNAVLMIELDGSNAGDASGLVITGANCTLKGLVINRFLVGVGIVGTGNAVQGNYIGTDVTGSVDLGNSLRGVVIFGASNNTIGGGESGAGNVISGNDEVGILIWMAGAFGNRVQGNYIGTDVSGSANLGNVDDGVVIVDASDNVVGGSQAREGNVISGNDQAGVAIIGFNDPENTSGNVVKGNYIGTNFTGSADLGNAGGGVQILDAPKNTIGGSETGERNIISGNDQNGIWIDGVEASGNVVQGNFIGTDPTGSADLGNGFRGVRIRDAPNNTIGGSHVGEGNVISGNVRGGIYIKDTGASGNVVAGNYIGTDVTGAAVLGNFNEGVQIEDAPDNRVGGSQPGEGNVISGNQRGIYIRRTGASGNVVQGNYIGTDVTGSADLGNAGEGVIIQDAPNNTIGGSQPGEGNVISGNDSRGIFVSRIGASGNVMQGNFIGTDVTGSADLGNGGEGVIIQDAPDNTIGGQQPGEGNVIAFNSSGGVVVGGSPEDTSVSNSVRGNAIYSNGALGIDLGDDGVSVNDDLDADTGPNNLQNFPVLTSALATESSARIVGSFESAPNEEYTLDFYASSEVDDSNHGEGERYLGSRMVMTDGLGNASFDLTLEEEARLGEHIAATATDSMGSTSEFSEVMLLSGGGTTAAAPFESAVELGDNWWFSDWFESFNTNFLPWIFHAQHSWMFMFEESTSDDIFFCDLSLEGWLFTRSAIYPNLYSFGRGAWIFYSLDTSGPRQFVDLDSGEFFSLE